MKLTRQSALLIAVVLSLLASNAKADEFFNAVAFGSGGTTVADSSHSIIHLTDNLITQQSSFVLLFGQNVTAGISWGGVPSAIVITENSTQTQATLTFPTTGFTRTFVGFGAGDLQNQIRDFIKGDGEKAYAQFLKSMNQISSAASLDGNPQASTALIADDVFSRFGIQNIQPTQYRSETGATYFGISGTGGMNRANDLNGTWADLSIESGLRFGSHVALSFGTTLAYRNMENSLAYTVAEEIGLPITIINNQGNGLSWQVAPWAFAGLSASYDQASGGLLVGGGGTSSLALHIGGFTLTLGDQISYVGNVHVKLDGYAFDTEMDQWILKNGIDGRFQIPGGPLFIEGGVSYSNFLRHAAVPNYWTPQLGMGFAFGKFSSILFSYSGDFGKRYNNNGGQVSLVLAY